MQVKVLLLEDDLEEAKAMEEYFEQLEDMELLATTGSAMLGFTLALKNRPEAIIVDIQLGEAMDGLSFLEALEEVKKEYRPFIVVTSCVNSLTVEQRCYKRGVQFYCRKSMKGYGPAYVVGKIRELMPFMDCCDAPPYLLYDPLQDERRFRAEAEFVLAEMTMDTGKEGPRAILCMLLMLLRAELENPDIAPPDLNAMDLALARRQEKSVGASIKAVQYALSQAWAHCSDSVLKMYYPFPLAPDQNCPSAKEFIHKFYTVIKKRLLDKVHS